MKKTYSLAAVLACTALFSGCASTPTDKSAPKTVSQLDIKSDDSFAFKVFKLGHGGHGNIKDKIVSDAEWEKINGSSGSVVAMNAAAGAAGLGVISGSGLSGGLLNAGLFFLGSGEIPPLPTFMFYQIVPAEQMEQAKGDLIKAYLPDGQKFELTAGVDGRTVVLVDSNYSDLPLPQFKGKFAALSISTTTLLSGAELKSLLNIGDGSGSYAILKLGIGSCYQVESSKLLAQTFEYPSYFYMPPKAPNSRKTCESVDKSLTDYPYIIDVNTKTQRFFVKM
ncbi:hypothetical protein [Shewanella sp. SM69]|uniref:hypothetical protein n=1 Tax=Shewanella TaxID=22 RepID=UPI0021DAF1E8|nr:hypothetical protein [Shewanella sp. SM69]MCU8040707.1 hypothetical protein [Shewanella sp. SM69]